MQWSCIGLPIHFYECALCFYLDIFWGDSSEAI